MKSRREALMLAGVGLLFLLLISVPYFYASAAASPDHYFGGFLFNPIDGNSYLAKMRQGYNGAWQFTLPYTAEPGEGAYLNLFYIFLGQVARIFNLSVLSTFHFARVITAFLLLMSLHRFFRQVFAGQRSFWLAFLLSLFASGLGWLAVPFGLFTSDFWVAEAYPFLSAYANPHFPLGIALQLYLLAPLNTTVGWRNGLKLFLAALLIAIVFPFGVPVVLLIWASMLLWNFVRREGGHDAFIRLVQVALGAGPILIYDYLVIQWHPQLSHWNAQNLTPTPPLWDLLIALSPSLLLAFAGLRIALRGREIAYRFLVSWLVLSIVLLYVPFNLQRRFLSSLFIPIAGLATVGLSRLAVDDERRSLLLALLVFLLSIPTNLIILATGFFGAATHDLSIYLTRAEVQALNWIDQNAPEDSLVLSSPDMGLFIPAHSGARVLYGHPFETVNAEVQERLVTDFFQSGWPSSEMRDFVNTHNVAYIFYGPREHQLGELVILESWSLVFQAGDVEIYQVSE